MVDFTILWADPQTAEEIAFARSLLPNGFTIVAPTSDDRGEAMGLARNAHAIVTQHAPVDASLIAAAPALQVIQKYGRREDGIDIAAAVAAGVPVAVMPLRGCVAVAELAMTLILALSKQLIVAHQATATGAYRDLGLQPRTTSQRVHGFQWMKLPHLREVAGTTLGIVGFGEIGTEVAHRARAFDMNVLHNKRSPLDLAIEQRLGVRYAALDDLLTRSDFIVLSAPHTPQTERMIGERELGLMKPDAYLVNIARGGLIDEAALYRALSERRIAGAGLDVFVEEPVPADNPLLALDNVIVTPHIGGGTGGARQKQMQDVLDNVVLFARNGTALHLL
jgi:D-3-phosphoglycerate dehydrogenase / 2-oxoglutarate reductase